MFGVSSILEGSKCSESQDYYKLLNCDETATVDQINTEFKVLALECHPDKNPENEAALSRFQSLQEAREILTDPKKRREYDKWRASEVSMSFKQWLALGTRVQTTMHWAKPRTQTMLESSSEGVENVRNNSENADHQGLQETSIIWQSQSQGEPSGHIFKQFRNYQI